jgi:tRNA(fMet)-specific endonuclease VapC
MKYLLDANIIIIALSGGSPALRDRIGACDAGEAVTSVIAFAEVAHGSVRGKPPPFGKLRFFISEIPALDFDMTAARAYATLPFKRASYDRLIAAHALALGLILVTDNEADFADVPGLKTENWAV